MRLATNSSLMKRNEDLIREIERTRRMNQDLKKLLRKMLTKELRLDKVYADKETQTEEIKPRPKSSVWTTARRDTPREVAGPSSDVSPQEDRVVFTGLSTGERNKQKYRKTPGQKMASQQEEDIDRGIVSSPIAVLADLYNVRIKEEQRDGAKRQTTKHISRQTPADSKSTSISPSFSDYYKELEAALDLISPIVFDETTRSPTEVLQTITQHNDHKFLLQEVTPSQGVLSPGMATSRLSTPAVSASQRSRREVRRPISYSETPLNVKIRSNYQFFKFT